MEISTTAARADLDAFLERLDADKAEVNPLIEGGGHENNTYYVFVSNLKALGRLFDIPTETLRLLAGNVQTLDSGETRFVGVGTPIRTNNILRHPGLLLLRSWHGIVPGVRYISITERTARDRDVTPALLYATSNYSLVSVARNLYHLDYLNAHGPHAHWNAIGITCSSLNDGIHARFTLHIPLCSAGERHNHEELSKIVARAYEMLPNA